MIQPQSKLPWFADGLDDICALYQDETVAIELYSKDAEYLVLACNNFPKAMELLNKMVAEYYKDPESLYSRIQIIEEFLKEINE